MSSSHDAAYVSLADLLATVPPGLFRAGAVDGLTKTNSSSIVATLFGLARRGKR